MRLLFQLLFALAVAANANAEAAAPMDVESCGNVTYIGECVGDTIRYCQTSGELLEVDCTDPVEGVGPQATCGLRDCTDEAAGCEGYYCVSRQGQPCGETYWFDWCDAGNGLGCIQGVCAPAPACDPTTYTTACNGSWAVFCNAGRVWEANCADLADWQLEFPGLPCGNGSCVTQVFPDAGVDAPDAATGPPSTDAASPDAGSTADSAVTQDSFAPGGIDNPDAGNEEEIGCGRARARTSSLATMSCWLLGAVVLRRRQDIRGS